MKWLETQKSFKIRDSHDRVQSSGRIVLYSTTGETKRKNGNHQHEERGQ